MFQLLLLLLFFGIFPYLDEFGVVHLCVIFVANAIATVVLLLLSLRLLIFHSSNGKAPSVCECTHEHFIVYYSHITYIRAAFFLFRSISLCANAKKSISTVATMGKTY